MTETEQKILDAAMRVFAREGYKGATTSRIAQEANVAELTLFRKFQSKDNLLKEVLVKKREPALSALDSLFRMEEDVDLTTNLRILGQNVAKAMRGNMKESEYLMFMFMLIEEGRRRPEIAEIFSSVFQMNIARLSEYFELQIKNGKMRNVNPQSAALVFVSYFVHTSILRGVLSDDVLGDSEKKIEEFIDIFTNGIIKVEDNKTR
jgi:TetR/AcrR family transcriptional regulator